MSIGKYKSRNKASVLYIKEILEKFSSIERPLSNAEIQRKLAQYPYNMDLHRETIKEILDELNAYDEDLYRCETTRQESTSGYSYGWYYNRSSSNYEDVRKIIEDIYDSPILPLNIAKEKEESLLSAVPKEIQESIKQESLKNIIIRQNDPNKKTYQTLNQIKQIIKDNKGNTKEEKHIVFNTNRYIIKNKKKVLEKIDRQPISGLPLAVVEWNYQLWVICYLDVNDEKSIKLENRIGHYRLDLMSDIKIISKPKTRENKKKKAIVKLSSKDAIKKYMNEHIYFGSPKGNEYIEDNKVYTCTLRIRNNFQYGITYFSDIFQDNFRLVAEKEDYYIVKVRCTQKTIENALLLYPDLIEIISPEELTVQISQKLERITKNLLINTNYVFINPQVFLFQEKMPGKVSDNEKWFYVDLVFGGSTLEFKVEEFINYLKNNGFKDKALRKRKGSNANRYLVTNQFDTYYEIAELIKEYGRKNAWFYNVIKTYSIYEYKYSLFNDNVENKKEREFYRVYYYKGTNSDTNPKTSLSSYLERKHNQ